MRKPIFPPPLGLAGPHRSETDFPHVPKTIGMEDAHSLHLSLPPTSGAEQGSKGGSAPEQPAGSSMTNVEGEDGPAFFGVFDGHGGK
jgi:hypothetical protein